MEQHTNTARALQRGKPQAAPVRRKQPRRSTAPPAPRPTTDQPIILSAEELEIIRGQRAIIMPMLAKLFGSVYPPHPESRKLRPAAADIIDRNFDRVIIEWTAAVRGLFKPDDLPTSPKLVRSLHNALIRFIDHLREETDLGTYVYLRHHCQQGMLAQANPSELNVIHIALKQILIRLIRAKSRGRRMEKIRDAVVAEIDERRMMVSRFYIESREHLLRESEEKYRNSIDHAPDPMYEVEPGTWTVLGANAAGEALHKTIPVESDIPLVGSRLGELGIPERRAEFMRHVEKVVQHGSDHVLDFEMAGRFFDLNSALVPYGNKRFVQVIMHDVSQRREMLDELLKAERLAAAGTFAAGVAHEVNNPLASISSLVQALMPAETDLERRSTMHTILGQITRISATLKDLVNFARPAPTHRGSLDLNSLINETLRLVAYNNRFNGITLESRMAPDLRPTFADYNEIQQVLLNLLINAADATRPDGGEVTIITENQPAGHNGERVKRVVMHVVDNGIGIPSDSLERVFDPFFTTKPAGAGAGLGLSLCQRIILSNKGTIRLDSRLGKGTDVMICLPVHEAEAPANAAGSSAQ